MEEKVIGKLKSIVRLFCHQPVLISVEVSIMEQDRSLGIDKAKVIIREALKKAVDDDSLEFRDIIIKWDKD